MKRKKVTVCQKEAHGDVSRVAAQPAHGHVTRVRSARDEHIVVTVHASSAMFELRSSEPNMVTGEARTLQCRFVSAERSVVTVPCVGFATHVDSPRVLRFS